MCLAAFLILSSLWLINNASGGGFLANQIFAAQIHFSWHDLQQHLVWLGPDAIILSLALFAIPVYIVGYFKRQEERDGPYRQQLAALVLATVVLTVSMAGALYLMGKHCASVNEVLVPMFAASWLVAMASDYMRRRMLLGLFLAFAAGFYVMNALTAELARTQSSMEKARDILTLTNFDKHLVLAEDCGLPMEVGAVSEFVDFPVFAAVWPRNSVQWQTIAQRVVNKSYGAIVVNSRDGCLLPPYHFWDADFIKLLKNNYKPLIEVKDDGRDQDFYVPR